MDSEFVKCKQCGYVYEALTQEIASYKCPKCPKPKSKLKMLDGVSLKYLTELDASSETQEPNKQTFKKNGDQ